MKPLSLLFAMLVITVSPAMHAQEKSICPSMCDSEKKQCHTHAQAQSMADVNPMIRFTPERRTGESLSEFQTRKNTDLNNMINERTRECDKSQDQCLKLCRNDELKADPVKPPFKDPLTQ